MAHLKTKETRGDAASRLAWKKTLVRMLYERGYERQEVLELYRLLDWMLKLPDREEALFQGALKRIEEELAMPYVTAIERMGEARGIQQGKTQVLRRQMSRRYGPLPGWVDERLEKATLEDLDLWTDRVLDATSIDDVFGSNGS